METKSLVSVRDTYFFRPKLSKMPWVERKKIINKYIEKVGWLSHSFWDKWWFNKNNNTIVKDEQKRLENYGRLNQCYAKPLQFTNLSRQVRKRSH
jgi:hypothetical protein